MTRLNETILMGRHATDVPNRSHVDGGGRIRGRGGQCAVRADDGGEGRVHRCGSGCEEQGHLEAGLGMVSDGGSEASEAVIRHGQSIVRVDWTGQLQNPL